MQDRTHPCGSVALFADADSGLAAGIATELAERHYCIDRVTPGEHTVGDPLAAVVIVERHADIAALRATLDSESMPTLVFAATRRLAEDVAPLLEARHDLATAADSADILVWRLQRLLERSRQSTAATAELDSLTGLLQRRAFMARLRQIAVSMAPGETTGLLFLDLDQFKSINDSLGHVAGDQALRAVATLLSRSLAPGDAAGRLGGDEFACLLRRPDTESILRDGTRLLQELSELDVAELREHPSLRIAASAGLTFVRPGLAEEDLLHEADMAMLEAKCGGRNRLNVYGQLADDARLSSRDLRVQHFENATRVATERLVEMITLKSRRLVDAARREADFCSLTGLFSRRYLDAQLAREIDHSRAQGRALSLALVDIDHFHVVNATHGWPTGDRVLQSFASAVQATVRSTDWIARYGGEEFLIVMPDTTLASARQVVERVRRAFAATTIESIEGQPVTATLSAGVAQMPDDAVSVPMFVNQASKALLRAKGAGRNLVEATG